MPGLQSVASATLTPASSSRRASGYGERVENSTPGSSVATVVAAGQRVDVGVGEVGAVVGAGGAELDGELHARARRPSWLACTRSPSPAARPGRRAPPGPRRRRRRAASRLAEDVDPAGVRRAGGQHRAGHQRRRSRRAARDSAGTTWAPRNVVSGVTSAASRRQRASSSTVSP